MEFSIGLRLRGTKFVMKNCFTYIPLDEPTHVKCSIRELLGNYYKYSLVIVVLRLLKRCKLGWEGKIEDMEC